MTESNTENASDVLRSAWKRFAELDSNALMMTTRHKNIRLWIASLGVVATLLAVVIDQFTDFFKSISPFLSVGLQILLIIVPIVVSVLAAIANKYLGSGQWLTLRAAAEELLKEIYLYRTVLKFHPDRDKWLSHRMTTILRRVYKSLGGQLVLVPYEGGLPPYHNPSDPNSDPGFNDLNGEEYLRYRLIDQRNWHRNRITQRDRERKRIQYTILAMGGLGALLAALGAAFNSQLVTWVAVTAAIASALTGWEQLRGLDDTVAIYSRVILELTVIRDAWESLPKGQRGHPELVVLVRNAENVLWAQSQKYVATMQEALSALEGDEARLVDHMIRQGNESFENIQAKMMAESTEVMAYTQARVIDTVDMAGATARSLVDAASIEAMAYADLAEASMEKTVEQSAAYRQSAEDVVDRALAESEEARQTLEAASEAAIDAAGDMADDAGEAMVAESEAMRDSVAESLDTMQEEMEAVRDSLEHSVDAAAQDVDALRETLEEAAIAESAATRESVEASLEATQEEMEALRDTAEAGVDTLLDESAEMRQTVDATVDKTAQELDAARQTLEQSADTLLEEAAEMRASAGQITEDAAVGMEAMRETMEESADDLLDEAGAVQETLEDSLDALVDESQAVRGTVGRTVERAISHSAELRQALEAIDPKSFENPDHVDRVLDEFMAEIQRMEQTGEDFGQDLIDQTLGSLEGEKDVQQAIVEVFSTGEEAGKSMFEEAMSELLEEDQAEDGDQVKG
jgi:hypothetical protein